MTMDYIQMIARCASVDNQEPYAKTWYPSVEPAMSQMLLLDKAKLLNYVLHAKHMNVEKKVGKIRDLIEEFEDEVTVANKLFF
jgi:hypothetical protein